MVTIVRRKIKGFPYYYLEHTLRRNGRFAQKSKYLGRTIPKDIESIKRQFVFELNNEKWFKDFEKIKRNYSAEMRALPESAREKEIDAFSIRFTYNTQRIEGSTLTLKETSQLLEKGISPGGKPVGDIKEAEVHRNLFVEMLSQNGDLSLSSVLDWHFKIFRQTKPDIAGKIRRHGVKITGSKDVPPAPIELQPMLSDFFRWYIRSKKGSNAVELAALAHLKFVTIHPFTDGNGRISRLVMNFILHRNGYPMLNIEYTGRIPYYNALERSQLNKEEGPFTLWFFRRYRREFRGYLSR